MFLPILFMGKEKVGEIGITEGQREKEGEVGQQGGER